jgi:Kazal-type serine protease inhibitor domain
MRAGTVPALAACLVGALPSLLVVRSAAAKSAYYEILNHCPCTGPTPEAFWGGLRERMACVDAVLEALRAQGWPDEILTRDRQREQRSRCGDPRYQCDGTPKRPCPRRTVCQTVDPLCNANGSPGVCQTPRALRRQFDCRTGPPACDCNGRTHASSCALWKARAVLAHPRACVNGCAGPGGATCGADGFCTAPSCGDGGAWGFCSPRPTQCTPGPPVCGCDGKTYPSACQANAFGVGVRAAAPCDGA